MGLSGCRGSGFTGTMAFTGNDAVAGSDGKTDLCRVGRMEALFELAAPDAFGGKRLGIPGIEAEDTIGLGHQMIH